MIKEKCGLRGNYDLKKPFALDATGRPLLQADAQHLEQDATQGGQRQGRKKPSEKRKDREGRDNKPQPQKVQPQTPPKSEAKRQRVAAPEAAPRGAAAEADPRGAAAEAAPQGSPPPTGNRSHPMPTVPDGAEVTEETVDSLLPNRIQYDSRVRAEGAARDANPDIFQRPDQQKACMRASPGFIYKSICHLGDACHFNHEVALPVLTTAERAQFWRGQGVTRFASGQVTKRASRGRPA